MSEQENIEKEIEAKKQELENVKRKEQIQLGKEALKPLSEWTDSEKIEQFDDFYRDALSMLKEKASGEESEDNTGYLFEAYMETLLASAPDSRSCLLPPPATCHPDRPHDNPAPLARLP